jgi:hypothetical protein
MLSFISKSPIWKTNIRSIHSYFPNFRWSFKQIQGKTVNRFLVPVIWTSGYLYYVKNIKTNCKGVGEDV